MKRNIIFSEGRCLKHTEWGEGGGVTEGSNLTLELKTSQNNPPPLSTFCAAEGTTHPHTHRSKLIPTLDALDTIPFIILLGKSQKNIFFLDWVIFKMCFIYRKEVFLAVCPDNKRDKATLLPIIKNNVRNYF